MVKIFFSSFITMIAIILLIGLAVQVSSYPDVHYSNTTHDCVEVINYKDTDAYSCENMPTRYNTIWIK